MVNKKSLALILLLLVILVVSVACSPAISPTSNINEDSVDSVNTPLVEDSNDAGASTGNMMPPPMPE